MAMDRTISLKRKLKATDLLDADATIYNDKFTMLGRYTVPKGGVLYIGGFDCYIYAAMVDDAAGAEHGVLQFVGTNPLETRRNLLYRVHTKQCGSQSAKLQKPAVPLSPLGIRPDSKLITEMKGDEDGDVVDVSACTLELDVTFKVLRV